jgi:hypothetical protein
MLPDFLALPEANVVANYDAAGQVVSFTIVDKQTNQPLLIMEPAEYAAYRDAGQATRGWYLLSPQWSLDLGSELVYAGQGNLDRAAEHLGYATSDPNLWVATLLGTTGSLASRSLPVRGAIGGEASADVLLIEQAASGPGGPLTNASGDVETAANAARTQPYGDGASASASPGAEAAGNTGASVGVDGQKGSANIENPVLGRPRTGSATKTDPQHSFPDMADNYVGDATKFSIPTKGPGGVIVRQSDLYQVEGTLNGKPGIFEWIVDQGQVTHRRFIPDGKITGFPNQTPSKR